MFDFNLLNLIQKSKRYFGTEFCGVTTRKSSLGQHAEKRAKLIHKVKPCLQLSTVEDKWWFEEHFCQVELRNYFQIKEPWNAKLTPKFKMRIWSPPSDVLVWLKYKEQQRKMFSSLKHCVYREQRYANPYSSYCYYKSMNF